MALVDLPEISTPLPWHAPVWEQLSSQVAAEQLPHALLFAGEHGCGVSRLALALARMLLCASPKGTFNCGECQACMLSARGSHGDFNWLEPEEKSRFIKVGQIREAVQFATLTSSFGPRKVIVVSPADNMSLSAYNSLLKTLEEPADDTYWLLVCGRMLGVPATIRSRCRHWQLARPNGSAALEWLDVITGERSTSEKLFRLANGRPLDAQELFVEGRADVMTGKRELLTAVIAGQIEVTEASPLWEQHGPDVFLDDLIESLQSLVGSLPLTLLKSRSGRAAFAILEEMQRLRRAVSAGSNPGKQLLIETTLLKIRRELGGLGHGDIMAQPSGDASP